MLFITEKLMVETNMNVDLKDSSFLSDKTQIGGIAKVLVDG